MCVREKECVCKCVQVCASVCECVQVCASVCVSDPYILKGAQEREKERVCV
jgi:hypothetical protein